MAKTKIYTKTGDQGETSLFTGDRVSKNDPNIEALGTIDECNCAIGLVIAHLPEQNHYDDIKKQLTHIQHTLFDLGAAVATPRSKASETKLKKTRFDRDGVDCLEKWIDSIDEILPEIHAFILPGGHPSSASLHLARAISRRAERQLVPLLRKGDITEDVIVYMNRLSDYLFMLSRFVNHLTNSPETFWKPHRNM